MDVPTAKTQILAKKTTNANLVRAINNKEIQVDGSGNVLVPVNGVFTKIADNDHISFALALP